VNIFQRSQGGVLEILTKTYQTPMVFMSYILASMMWFIATNAGLEIVYEKTAMATLVTGSDMGYVNGSLALAQSLIDIGSKLHRIVLVTPSVKKSARKLLRKFYEVIDVPILYCEHRLNNRTLSDTELSYLGDKYKTRMKLFSVS
jgi:hypothetical protein